MLCRGREAAERAAATARETFERGGAGGGLPQLDVPRATLEAGLALAARWSTPSSRRAAPRRGD